MKKIFVLSVLLACCFVSKAYDYDFSAVAPTGQTLYYTILSRHPFPCKVEVTHPVNSTSRSGVWSGHTKPAGALIIPSSVSYEGYIYSVTSVGFSAFFGCSGLTSVTIPNSVYTIYDYAFSDCNSLTSVTIPNSVTLIGNDAFYGCSSLTSVTIPNSVTSIGNDAFYGCSSLTNVTIGNSVRSIGSFAFYNCNSLSSVTIPNSVTSIGTNAFNGVKNIVYSGNATGSPWGALTVNGYVEGDLIYENASKTKVTGCNTAATNVTIPNSVTSIGNYAFSDCSSLSNVIIPNSVTSIGDYAFSDCSSLSNVIIPNSVTSIGDYAFFYCSSLSNVIIPNSVTSIGDYAFYGCSSLTSVVIPNSMTSIGYFAFGGCTSLTSMNIPNSVTSIGTNAFNGVKNIVYSGNATGSPWGALTVNGYIEGDLIYENASKIKVTGCSITATNVTIPNSVTSIGNNAFRNCSSLASVTIGNSVTSIGLYTFYGCANVDTIYYNARNLGTSSDWYNSSSTYDSYGFRPMTNLHTIIIGDSVQTLPAGVFYNQSHVTNVDIPNSVTLIGGYAFYGCSSLTSVTIGNSVTSIGLYAFYGCANVDTIYYNARNLGTSSDWYNFSSSYDSYGFRPMSNLHTVIIGDSVLTLPDGVFYHQRHITNVTIPNSVTSVGQGAFAGCDSLTRVAIGNSVTTIGNSAFNGCSGLTSVTIGNSVTLIGGYAFYGCSSLTSVTIGNSVTSIGLYAFYGCSSLTSVVIPNSMTHIGYFAFVGCANVDTIYYNAQNLGTSSDWYNSSSTYDSYGFRPMTNLHAIIIGDSVQTLPDGVFYNQRHITNVTIPNSVTLIGGYAFYGCSSLTSVVIGNSVTSIGNDAFFSCSSLHTIFSYNPTAPTLGNISFYGCPIQEIHIPCSDSYRSRWSMYQNYFITPPAPFERVLQSADSTMGTVSLLTLACADTSTISAIPNTCYHFTRWSDGNTDNPRTFVLTQDTTFTAEFSFSQYTITTASNYPEMGSTFGDTTVDCMEQVTLTAIPNYGYHFVGWSDITSSPNPRTVTVTQDRTYTARFTYNTYHVTKNCDNAKGTINGSSYANYLSSVTLTAIPNYGYHFTQWSDGNTSNPRTFVLTQDTTFTAEFDRNSYTITGVVSDVPSGLVQGSGNYLYLDTAGLYAMADHYHFTHWQDGNTENPRRVVVYSDSIFTAHFVIDTYHVAVVSSDINMGYVAGGGDIIYGQPVTVEATAYSGYHFSCWSNGSRYNPYTFAAIQDLTLSAVFVSDEAPFYTITVAANNAAMGRVEGSGTYDDGTVALLTATPFDGCQFLHWSDGSTEAQHLVTINATATYTAYFAPESCSVTTETNDANAGTATGDGIYYMGDTLSLTATANEGYRFTHWSDGNTDAVRSIVVDENLSTAMQSLGGDTYGITFTAYFENGTEGIEELHKNYALTVVGNAIRIIGAMGETMRVYDVVGRQLLTKKLDNEDIRLDQTGVFFVQVGNAPAEKVVLVR